MEYITSQIAFKGQNADPTLALIEGTITLDPTINKPGYGGNTISIDVAQASTGVIEYTSRSYPTNANFIERPGVVVEYNINFGNSLNFGLVLPNGYIQCDFLESTGTQYIDTGITLSNESEVNISYSLKQRGDNQYIFGTQTSWNKDNFSILAESLLHPDNIFVYCLATNAGAITWLNAQHYDQRREMYVSSAYGHLDGAVATNPAAGEIFETAKSARLFTNSAWLTALVKIYSLSISRSGTSQLNYVPTLDAQGVPCMWDTVSKTAKYNSGSGSFVAGMNSRQALNLANLPVTEDGTLTVSLPESIMDATYNVVDPATISALDVAADNGWTITIQSWVDAPVVPEGYIRGDFLESTGTQRIDTGYTSATAGAVQLVVQDTIDNNNGYAGACTSWDTADSFYIRHMLNQDRLVFFVGSTVEFFNVVHGERLNIYFDKTKAIVNEQSVVLSDATFVGSDVPFFILRGGNFYGSRARCFSASLYDVSTNLVRNYIPALDTAGKPCMYDKVSKTPFYNAGTGEFIFGLTSEQALNLANLPTTAKGSLTVSLPEVVVGNGEVFVPSIKKAFDTATANGWTLTIQTYGDGLPEGSIPLDFLESTGTQYIDTGIKLSNESEVRGVVSANPNMSTSFVYVYGGMLDTWLNSAHFVYLDPTRLGYGVGKASSSLAVDISHVSFALNSSELRYNGNTKPITSTQIFEQPFTCPLFGNKRGDSAETKTAKFSSKIYNFSVANQTTPQANYVPIITAEGVPAMWDYVSKTAKLNAGTGSFIAGLTSEQATKLANLPAGGGELTISLPQGDVTDAGEVYTEAIKAAVDTAADNGWTLTIQTYGDELPGGCVPCEFLESTGTQWVDTGIMLSNESEVRAEFAQPYQTGKDQYIFGASGNSNTRNYSILAESALKPDRVYAYCVGADSSMMFWANAQEFGKKRNMYISAVYAELDGVRANNSIIPSTFNTCSAYLFARHHENGGTARGVSRFYSMTISKSSTKQGNYTPIITSAGVPAMWDSVTRTAKYNAGTGSFVVGLTAENALKLANLPATTGGTLTISLPSEVVDENGVLQDTAIADALLAAAAKGWTFIIQTYEGTTVEIPLPQDYMECEFLESTGTQYLDTGIKLSSESVIDGSAALANDSAASIAVWGNYSNTDKYSLYWHLSKKEGVDALIGQYQGVTWFNSATIAEVGKKYQFKQTRGELWIDGELTKALDVEDFSLDFSAALFCVKQPGELFNYKSASRIYSFSIARAGVRQLNYTPAISPDGAPCMWDGVTAQPFTNAGTGQFVVGMTAEQARKLGNLPVTTNGTLTISLPPDVVDEHGMIQDAAIFAALSEAAAKGWTFILQTHDGTTVEAAVPAGYMECEFLESTGEQTIMGAFLQNDYVEGEFDFQFTEITGTRQLFGLSGSGTYFGINVNGNWEQLNLPADLDTHTAKIGVTRSSGEYFVELDNIRKDTQAGSWWRPETVLRCHPFTISVTAYPCHVRSYGARATDGTNLLCNYIPCLDSAGVPCMYDSVTAQPLTNAGTGSFVVGMTADQARKLGNLPDGGGTLTISLPSDVVDENGVLQDMTIFAALSQAAAKGWNFILQTHDGTTVETAVPAGYMECEFLENTGEQWLATQNFEQNNIAVTFESQFTALSVASERQLFGLSANNPWLGVSADGATFLPWPVPFDTDKHFFKIECVRDTNTCICAIEDLGLSNSKTITSGNPLTLALRAMPFSLENGMFITMHLRCYSVVGLSDNVLAANLTPAITPEGTPCMYDSVTSLPFTNQNTAEGTPDFVVGMTAAQAIQLANLPEDTTDKNITVSLPQSILNDAGEITDAAVRAALNKAADNGWDITLQYYTEGE